MTTYCMNCATRPVVFSKRCDCHKAMCHNCWEALFQDSVEYKPFRKTIFIKNDSGNYEEVTEVLYSKVIIDANPVCPECGELCEEESYENV